MTLVVMGASDAYGIGTDDPDRENWPTQLANDLPQPVHLVNLGVPGATLAQAQQQELPIAIAQHPQALVLWLAVNDIIDDVPLATYASQLRATLASLKAQSPGTHVFVGNLPDLSQLPFFSGYEPATLRAEVSAWNGAIAQACAAEGATLADLANGWGQMANHPGYISDDGLHPSRMGALELAAFFDIVIRQTLKIND
jgi:lysophospholipase L1-like esterase